MGRVVRLSSDTPSSRSSAARVRTTVGREVPRAFAAAVRLPLSTMRTKVVIARSLSTAGIITPIYGTVYYRLRYLFHSTKLRYWLAAKAPAGGIARGIAAPERHPRKRAHRKRILCARSVGLRVSRPALGCPGGAT